MGTLQYDDDDETEEEAYDQNEKGKTSKVLLYDGWFDDLGRYHGHGRLTWKNGDSYEGDFVHGRRHGRGLYKWGNSDRQYQGEFENNVRHGLGTFFYGAGNYYQGSFVNGHRHGYGRFVFADTGSAYDGEWKKGAYDGKGTLVLTNGETYIGEFVNGHLHCDNGKFLDASGKLVYEGPWTNGQRGGPGTGKAAEKSKSSRDDDATTSTIDAVVTDSVEPASSGQPLENSQSEKAENKCVTANSVPGPELQTGSTKEDHASYEHPEGAAESNETGAFRDKESTGSRSQLEVGTTTTVGTKDELSAPGDPDASGQTHTKEKESEQLSALDNQGAPAPEAIDSNQKAVNSTDLVETAEHERVPTADQQEAFLENHNESESPEGEAPDAGKIDAGDKLEAVKADENESKENNLVNDPTVSSGTNTELLTEGDVDINDGKTVDEPLVTSPSESARVGDPKTNGQSWETTAEEIGEGETLPVTKDVPVSWATNPEEEDDDEDDAAAVADKNVQVNSTDKSKPDSSNDSTNADRLPPMPSQPPPPPPPIAYPYKSFDESDGPEGECMAVVDRLVEDSQGNAGKYTGIVMVIEDPATREVICKPHGVGRMAYSDGKRIHEGFWSGGSKEGHGRCLFFPQGDFHEGDYHKNLRHGPGRYQWKDGRSYVGHYLNDLRHGEGTFTYANGDVYQGTFVQGQRCGFGRFTFGGDGNSSTGKGFYEGRWAGGKYDGKGKLVWSPPKGKGDGFVYEGEFANGVFHGQGVKRKTIGSDEAKSIVQEGKWVNGRFCPTPDSSESPPNKQATGGGQSQ